MYNVCTGFVLGGDKGRAGIGSEEILKKTGQSVEKTYSLNFFPEAPQSFLTIKKTQSKIMVTQNPCSSQPPGPPHFNSDCYQH